MLWKRFFDLFATTNGMSVFDDTPMEWVRTSFERAQKVQDNCLAQRSAHVSRGGCEERTCDGRDGPRVFGLEHSLQNQAHNGELHDAAHRRGDERAADAEIESGRNDRIEENKGEAEADVDPCQAGRGSWWGVHEREGSRRFRPDIL